MSRIRVLHLSRGREWRGGERQVRLLARAQRGGLTVDPTVLTAAGSALATVLAADDIPSRTVPWRWALDPRALWAAVGALRAWRRASPDPALLHAHDAHALQSDCCSPASGGSRWWPPGGATPRPARCGAGLIVSSPSPPRCNGTSARPGSPRHGSW